jgi:ribosomal protein L12E/L44/L45/RPP1/RPP2
MDANMARIRDYLKENVDRPAPEGGAPPRKRARPADQKDTIADGEKEEEEEQREEEEEKEDEDDSFSLDEKDSDPSEDERRCDSAASMNS